MPIGLKQSLPRLFFGFVLTLIVVLSVSDRADAQIPDLIITVGDTIATSGEQNAVITVFMDNFFDSVAAFSLWLKIGNNQIMEFQTDTQTVYDTTWWICVATGTGGVCVDSVGSDADTTYWVCNTFSGPDCIDSTQVNKGEPFDFFVAADTMYVDTTMVTIGNFDTAGTMTSGWEFITSRSVFGNGNDIKVTGVADRLTVPGIVPAIAPQQGGVLFRLLGDVFQIPDTLQDRTSAIIPDPFIDHYSFSTPDGGSLGLSDSLYHDTTYWECVTWQPPNQTICLDSQSVSGDDPWDFFEDTIITVSYIDTVKLKMFSGSLTVLQGACGDIDGAEGVDIGDITYLIAYLFIGGPEPSPLSAADVDCQGVPPEIVDIGDLTWLIAFLFLGGPDPCSCAIP